MALCRCSKSEHRPKNNKKHTYLYAAKPVGHPKTSSICGRVGCENIGLVFLTQSEFDDFTNKKKLRRIFRYGTHTTQVKVSDDLPIHIDNL